MKSKVFLIIVICTSSILSQDNGTNKNKLPNLIPYRVDELFGYCDSAMVIKIPPKYDDAFPFNSYNVACVVKNDKYGLIDTNGVEIIPTAYKKIIKIWGNNNDWRVLVEENTYQYDFYTLLNKYNEPIFQTIDSHFFTYLTFDSLQNICDEKYFYKSFSLINNEITRNYTFFHNKKLRMFSNDFEKIFPNRDFTFLGFKDHSLFLIDTNNVSTLLFSFDDFEIGNNLYLRSDSLLFLRRSGFFDSDWQLYNTHGEKLTPILEDIGHFFGDDTLMAVKFEDGWGYINKKGEIKIKPKFENAKIFSDSLAAVQNGNGWGYIDYGGNFIVDPKFDFASDFSEKTAYVSLDRSIHIIDNNGKFITNKDSKYEIISDLHGKEIDSNLTSITIPEFAVFGIDSDKSWDYLWGILDKNGREIIPAKFHEIGIIRNGIFPFTIDEHNRLWGFGNTNGDTIISNKFENVYYLSKDAIPYDIPFGAFPAEGDLITEEGFFQNDNVKFEYSEGGLLGNSNKYIISSPMEYLFYNNIARVEYNEKIVYVDLNGNIYIKNN